MQSFKQQIGPLGTLLLFSLLLGWDKVALPMLTVLPTLALPSALSLPLLFPPLAFAPVGLTGMGFWIADLAGVAVMLLVALAQISISHTRHPQQGKARAFFSGLWATVLGVVAGNIVRLVYVTFVGQTDPTSYVALFGLNLVFSVLTGLVVGTVVGLVAALLHSRRDKGAGEQPAPKKAPRKPSKKSATANA